MGATLKNTNNRSFCLFVCLEAGAHNVAKGYLELTE